MLMSAVISVLMTYTITVLYNNGFLIMSTSSRPVTIVTPYDAG